MPEIDGAYNIQPVDPYWQTTDGETVRLYLGEVLEVLASLPDRSVQCVVTSPPYWGLRDYGTAEWVGGDPGCSHRLDRGRSNTNHTGKITTKDRSGNSFRNSSRYVEQGNLLISSSCCSKCGAVEVNQAIGSEPTPEEYVERLVRVFREVRRVLRDDGVLWINLGDTYSSGGRETQSKVHALVRPGRGATAARAPVTDLPSGNLYGMPWRVALALQADGWVLRADIPWVKRNTMPESVRNRPAKALEYVFMLTKSMDYYYDLEAVKVSQSRNSHGGKADQGPKWRSNATVRQSSCSTLGQVANVIGGGRNFRNADLWFNSIDTPHGLTWLGDEMVGLDVTTKGYPGAHFATFTPELVRPLIMAATSEWGACVDCGVPWRRVIKPADEYARFLGKGYTDHSKDQERGMLQLRGSKQHHRARDEGGMRELCARYTTLGWQPGCGCYGVEVIGDPPAAPLHDQGVSNEEYQLLLDRYQFEYGAWLDHWNPLWEEYQTLPVVPCVVLDPFIGSGTTAEVCLDEGRRCWGIDLSEDYLLKNAIPRVEGRLMSTPVLRGLVPGQDGGGEMVEPLMLGESADETEEQ